MLSLPEEPRIIMPYARSMILVSRLKRLLENYAELCGTGSLRCGIRSYYLRTVFLLTQLFFRLKSERSKLSACNEPL